MDKIFSWRILLTSLIGTGIASSIAVPAEAIDKFVESSTKTEVIVSQNFDRTANDDEPADDFKNIVGLTGLAIGTGVVGYHLTRAYKPSLVNSLPNTNKGHASLIDRVKPKLRKELLRLVHNQAVATRLLSGTLTSHPGRSANWAAEKVIYDLKRGR